MTTGGWVVALPGIHWEYQSLTLVQVYPDTQLVPPVHPLPPPGMRLIRPSEETKSIVLTLLPRSLLGRNGECKRYCKQKGVEGPHGEQGLRELLR